MTVDGFVLPQTPYEAYENGKYNEEARLHGFNLQEGEAFILFNQASMKNYEETGEKPKAYKPTYFNINTWEDYHPYGEFFDPDMGWH